MTRNGINEERIGLLQEREKRLGYSAVEPFSSHYIILNQDKDDEITCYGYAEDRVKNMMFIVGSCVLLFIPFLLVRWFPQLNLYLRMRKVSLGMADSVLIKSHDGVYYTAAIRAMMLETPNLFKNHISMEEDQIMFRYFYHQHIMYYYHRGNFYRLQSYERDVKLKDFATFTGYSQEQQAHKLKVFGPNLLDRRIPSTGSIFFCEVVTPFYVFQIFSCLVWFCSGYILYAICILALCLFSMVLSTLETVNQLIKLTRTTSGHSHAEDITVLRDSKDMETIHSSNVVPGDVILLKNDKFVMNCDAVIIRGSCTVDESDLTGASVPVVKVSVGWEDELYSPETHPHNTVLCGTRVLQSKSNTMAVVVRTGFYTAQGEQLRVMDHQERRTFQFNEDCKKLLFWLGLIASLGFSVSCFYLTKSGVEQGKVLLHSLVIITIVIPPALPIVTTLASYFAQVRLMKKDIYTTSPGRTSVLGGVDVVCFDKTGTLTENGLSLKGVLPVCKEGFVEMCPGLGDLDPEGLFFISMASCHNLTLLDGIPIGDPLDLIIFAATGWVLAEDSNATMWETGVRSLQTNRQINILKTFPFSSTLKRMTVIATDKGVVRAFMKGSPEAIHTLCDKSSIPESFYQVLEDYTRKGYRVIAYAHNPLEGDENEVITMKRSDIEMGAHLLGFVCLHNPLKEDSKPVIQEIREAGLRCIMVTGDNIGTGISVTRELGMIRNDERIIVITASLCKDTCVPRIVYSPADAGHLLNSNTRCHLALNGTSWNIIYGYQPDLLSRIVLRGVVFAGMQPEQKEQLINVLREQQYVVGMCGNGTNDWKALKAADVGISLSGIKTTGTSSFTFKDNNISCVPILMKEGRYALMTGFGLFKYMILYSLIQFSSVLFLYVFQCGLSMPQHFYVDLIIVITLAILMAYTDPCDYLSRRPPFKTLLAWQPVLSLLGQTQLVIVFQIITIFIVTSKAWKSEMIPTDGINYFNPLSTSLFVLCAQQFINMACLFSYGEPYREPAFFNAAFMLTVFVLTIINSAFLLGGLSFLNNLMSIAWPVDPGYQYILLGIISVNLLVAFVFEHVVVNIAGRKLDELYSLKRGPRHSAIDKEIHPNWPYEDLS